MGPTEPHAYGAWLQSEREALGWSRDELVSRVDSAARVPLEDIEEGRVEVGGRLRERIGQVVQTGKLAEQVATGAQPLESALELDLGPAEKQAYGAWVKAERSALRWSQRKLHTEASVELKHLRDIEAGRVRVGGHLRKRVALALRAGRLESTLDLGPAEQAEYATWLQGRLTELGLRNAHLVQMGALSSKAYLEEILTGGRNPRRVLRVRIAEALQNVRGRLSEQPAPLLGPADLSEYRDWLKGWRDTLDLSQEELARAAGVNVTHLKRVEAGTRNPGDRSFRPNVFAALERLKLERGWLPAEGAEGRAVSGQASR
ncbi:helix-turn-helix transcriptional regulator, partial [Streptomyces sp. NPDC048663]|uniref:helix-turn-helix domain-containing protein n=1 Tax=Streptomyces sp. NPDC048663 TaxID=3155638 RepID=UPI00341A43D4